MNITYIQNQPHCYAFGGFEIQMLAAYEAVKKLNYNVGLFNPWDRVANFDIVHLWGFEINQYHNIIYSKKAGKKIVVTTLMPDMTKLLNKLKFFGSGYIYKVKILRELALNVDIFIAINDIEKEYIAYYFKFPKNKIQIIPNIVSHLYFENNYNLDDLGITNFVLCTGNICKRKNQLNLVKACNLIGANVLLIGNVIEGESQYGEAVVLELEKNPNSKWMKEVKENSNVLRTAYKTCLLFALISHGENQPISVLEAMASGCKIILSDVIYTYQNIFSHLPKVDPNNVNKIADKLNNTLSKYINVMANSSVLTLTEEKIGKMYIDIYNKLV